MNPKYSWIQRVRQNNPGDLGHSALHVGVSGKEKMEWNYHTTDIPALARGVALLGAKAPGSSDPTTNICDRHQTIRLVSDFLFSAMCCTATVA